MEQRVSRKLRSDALDFMVIRRLNATHGSWYLGSVRVRAILSLPTWYRPSPNLASLPSCLPLSPPSPPSSWWAAEGSSCLAGTAQSYGMGGYLWSDRGIPETLTSRHTDLTKSFLCDCCFPKWFRTNRFSWSVTRTQLIQIPGEVTNISHWWTLSSESVLVVPLSKALKTHLLHGALQWGPQCENDPKCVVNLNET